MIITDRLLTKLGWQIRDKSNYGGMRCQYIYSTNNVHLTLTYGASNYINRFWIIHVDNADFETIGSMDVQTTEQFNLFMKALDIKYEIPSE